MYGSLERSPQNTRDGFDLYSAQASLAWPRVNLARPGASFLGLVGLYPWSLSKSAVFFSLSGKALLVSISDAILFLRSQHVYFSLDFEFRGKS